jgi:ABC-type multidrug transport system fused ATPase/permease subunit
MELLFSPNGRIDQPTYWRAVLILFGISAVLTVVSAYVSPFLGFASIIFIWPWIAVHVKRFHDAGKTGWLTLAMIVLAIVVSAIASFILPGLFGVDVASMQREMEENMEDYLSSNDPGAAMVYVMQESKRISQAQLLPSILSTGIVTACDRFCDEPVQDRPERKPVRPGPGRCSHDFQLVSRVLPALAGGTESE